MPTNKRPSGLFGEFDYGWEDTTLNQRIQAQNTWDLLAAQEENNNLLQQKIEQDKENARLLANATLESAKITEGIENKKLQTQIQLKQMEQEFALQMRYTELCDKLGIGYNTLKVFIKSLNYLSEDESNTILSTEQKIRKNTNIIKELDYKIEHPQTLNSIENQIKTVEDDIKRGEKETTIFPLVIIFNLLTLVLSPILYVLRSEYSIISSTIIVILWLIILNTTIIVKHNIKKKEFLAPLRNELKGLRFELELNSQLCGKNLLSEHQIRKQELINQTEELITLCSNLVEEASDRLDKRVSDFTEFRKQNYNKKVENLFRTIEIKLDPIKEEDIIHTGKVEDYTNYIMNK